LDAAAPLLPLCHPGAFEHRASRKRRPTPEDSGKLLIVQITVGNLEGSIRQQTGKTIGIIGRSSSANDVQILPTVRSPRRVRGPPQLTPNT
jgi:hypothetical protein